jgi:hypothetical protein
MALLNTALVGDAMGIFKTRSDISPMVSTSPSSSTKELNSVTMSRDEDPNVMLDKLEGLRARYNILGLPVLKDTINARALVVAPIEYASDLTAEKRIKENSHSTLPLDDVRSSMDTQYSTNYSDGASSPSYQHFQWSRRTRSRQRTWTRKFHVYLL